MSMQVDDSIIIEQLTEVDNRVLYMDIFGSWVEFGMVAAALAVGVAIVLMSVKIKFNKMKDKGWLSNDSAFWNAHTIINETLTELRVKSDCARTQIVQFHNGGQFLDGISMKKMSLTHESLRNGVSTEMSVKKDLLLSMCVDGLTLLTKDTPNLYITETLDDSWCKQLLQNSNVISFSFLPLRKHNDIIGYIMCQWCSLAKVDEIDEEDMSILLEKTRRLIEVQLHLENKGKLRNV